MDYKGFKIVGDGTFGYKRIKPEGQGSIPKILNGAYTKTAFAERDIDMYVNAKEQAEAVKEANKRPVLKTKPIKDEINAKDKESNRG